MLAPAVLLCVLAVAAEQFPPHRAAYNLSPVTHPASGAACTREEKAGCSGPREPGVEIGGDVPLSLCQPATDPAP